MTVFEWNLSCLKITNMIKKNSLKKYLGVDGFNWGEGLGIAWELSSNFRSLFKTIKGFERIKSVLQNNENMGFFLNAYFQMVVMHARNSILENFAFFNQTAALTASA